MKYFLAIEDCAADVATNQSAVKVSAEGDFSDGVLNLKYVYDGASYVLSIGEKSILHERLGDINMKMEFAQGRRTFCRIYGGGYEGGFSVETKAISTSLSPENCEASVEFRICGSDEKEDGYFIRRIAARPAK